MRQYRYSNVCVPAQLLTHVQLFCNPMDCSARLLCPWDSPGKDTGVGIYALLQGVFLTQGLKLCLLYLPYCRQILYP